MSNPVIIGNATLYLGDCRDILPTLGEFDALVADPPYGIGERKGSISIARNRNAYDGYLDTPENVASEIVPAVVSALAICKRAIITVGGKCFHMYPAPTDIGMIYQPAACGMTHWGRTTCQPVYFYGKDPMSGKTIKPIHFQSTEATEKNGHPCPKPIGLMMKIVDRASLEGESVLDILMGSGTTGVACANLGRMFTGIEREPKYFDIACRRIEDAQRQGRLM